MRVRERERERGGGESLSLLVVRLYDAYKTTSPKMYIFVEFPAIFPSYLTAISVQYLSLDILYSLASTCRDKTNDHLTHNSIRIYCSDGRVTKEEIDSIRFITANS